MIAGNAAMDDDDNEAGMADCDCLSEYQDDAGEMLTQREPRGDPAEIPCHVTLLSPPEPEYSTQGGPLHNGTKQFLPSRNQGSMMF